MALAFKNAGLTVDDCVDAGLSLSSAKVGYRMPFTLANHNQNLIRFTHLPHSSA